MTSPAPHGGGSAAAMRGQADGPARRFWMQQVETGEVRAVGADEAAALAPPWWEISADHAAREHRRLR